MKARTSSGFALAIAVAATLGATLVPTESFAFNEDSPAAINVDSQGIGLQGHDPVAYFTVGEPTLGKPEFTASHGGIKYLFASKANRDAFKANPAKFAPQYGGFCAMGVANERKFDGDPSVWHVEGGKLFLNVNKDVQKKWLEDVNGNNVKANVNWPQIRNKTPKSLG